MDKRYYQLVYAAVMISIPSVATANAGTPMMWAAMLHLTLGNLVIGIIEGSLIAWLFKVNRNKAVALMVTANYISAYAGALGLGFLQELLSRASLIQTPLYDAPKLLWVTGVALFVATVIIEYPFSLIVMPSLFLAKYRTGKSIGSSSLVADSKETLACAFLSLALFIGLGANYFFDLWWADPAVGLVIVGYLVKEGYSAWTEGDLCG